MGIMVKSGRRIGVFLNGSNIEAVLSMTPLLARI
jgi:hypothetical protein